MTRSRLSIFIAAVAALGSFGCSRRVPVATVVLVDPSASVTERARRDEFAAVATLIPRMQRGDLLTIIPITDNAAAAIEGRVLRFHAPERREAYDADLRRFQTDAGKQHAEFAANLLAHPGRRTDILGAPDVASQEFEGIPTAYRRTLIVLSDFLEDDGTLHFGTDSHLSNTLSAANYPRQTAGIRKFKLEAIPAYLGKLENADAQKLSPNRQAALKVFWVQYMSRQNYQAEVRYDGTALFILPAS